MSPIERRGRPRAIAWYAAQLEELSDELFSESASLYDEFGAPLHTLTLPPTLPLTLALALTLPLAPTLTLTLAGVPLQDGLREVNRHLRAHRLLAAGQTLRPVEKMITQACLAPRDGQVREAI